MERSLLGAILAGHKKASEALDAIKPGDFFNDQHRKIAGTMLELYATGVYPDLLSVHDELTRTGDAEKAGGISYISSLTDGVATGGDILYIVRGDPPLKV
ncbi:MAG TPA: DnaB-like helicase N-terminal domain-containing protein [Candidatus Dormibacteraeota bacterium]|nr:DnaB-like helicase N-terminal domain-containing protein [Candidatus Dormibacteraeota bacterium]